MAFDRTTTRTGLATAIATAVAALLPVFGLPALPVEVLIGIVTVGMTILAFFTNKAGKATAPEVTKETVDALNKAIESAKRLNEMAKDTPNLARVSSEIPDRAK